jgi:hypothetical protein
VGETLAQHGFAMSEPFSGSTQFQQDWWEVKTTSVCVFGLLEKLPSAFLRIPFGRRSRQRFQRNALGCPSGQKSVDHRIARDARSLPENQQRALTLSEEKRHKASNIWTVVRVVWHVHAEPAVRRNTASCSDRVSSPLHLEDRGLACGRRRAPSHRQPIQTGRICEDHGLFCFCGFPGAFLPSLLFPSLDRRFSTLSCLLDRPLETGRELTKQTAMD